MTVYGDRQRMYQCPRWLPRWHGEPGGWVIRGEEPAVKVSRCDQCGNDSTDSRQILHVTWWLFREAAMGITHADRVGPDSLDFCSPECCVAWMTQHGRVALEMIEWWKEHRV